MKKKIIFSLVLMLILGLCGCGKKNENSSMSATAPKDYVYRVEEVKGLPEDQGVNRFLRAGDKIYAYGYTWEEDTGDAAFCFYQLKEDGTIGESYQIPMEKNSSFSNISMDGEGNIYGILDKYQGGGEADPETGETVEETEYTEEYFLVKMNLQGEIIFSIKFDDVPEIRALKEENGYFYVGNMILDEGKGIYVTIYGNLVQFDLDGSFVKITMSQNSEFDGISFVTLQDGRVVAITYEEDGIVISLANMEAGTFGEKHKLQMGAVYDYSFYSGIGYDLYLSNSNGIYGYNLGDTESTKLMSYVDSDLNVFGVYNMMAINEREFFATYDGEEGTVVARFIKVDPKDVKDKKQITLAMLGINWMVRQKVVTFNKTSEEYRITIIDYSSLDGMGGNYNEGINRLNTDIVSGKVPDVLLLENSMPVDSYISKGLFEDLKPYIEKDEELNIEDFAPNVIEAFSVDGRLYSLVPSYYINTIVAKASDVGNESGWTVQEAMDVLSSKPEGTQFLSNVTRDEMLNNCMSMAGSQFVDWKKGTCNFNSDGFLQMLEFINSFPEKLDDTAFSDNYWNNYDSMWREGKVLASWLSISDFRSYNYQEKGTFGEKITMIGFPTSDGKGTVISPSLQFAMSAKSGNKDGVWQFLRSFLTDEYQKNVNGLPFSVKHLDEMGERAMEKPYYMDENNNKVEYDDYYYVGGIEIVIPPMTEQEVSELKEQIYSVTDVYKYDEKLLNIIQEETAPFFAGQKSAKDVAAIIQSRAQIYINENR